MHTTYIILYFLRRIQATFEKRVHLNMCYIFQDGVHAITSFVVNVIIIWLNETMIQKILGQLFIGNSFQGHKKLFLMDVTIFMMCMVRFYGN